MNRGSTCASVQGQIDQYEVLTRSLPLTSILVVSAGSVALLVARRTNDRKVAGSRPTKVVCITVLTGSRMGVNCPL